jgi:hypothetical protein
MTAQVPASPGTHGSDSGGELPRGQPRMTHRRVDVRLPHAAQLLAIGASFCCEYALLDQPGGHLPVHVSTVCGAIAFCLLFTQMRLADDIADVEDDVVDATAAVRHRARHRIAAALAIAVILTLALSWWSAAAVAWAAAASAAIVIGPLAVRRLRHRIWPARFLLSELGPALAMAYVYPTWAASAGHGMALWRAWPAPALFWAAYQSWKFQRKIGTSEYQPYGVSDHVARRILAILAVFATIDAATGSWLAGWSPLVPISIGALSAITVRTTALGEARQRAIISRGPAGLAFSAGLVVCVVVSLFLAHIGIKV